MTCTMMKFLIFDNFPFFPSHRIEHVQTSRSLTGIQHVYFRSSLFSCITQSRWKPFRILSFCLRALPPASFFSPPHNPLLAFSFPRVASQVTSFLREALFVSHCTCSTRVRVRVKNTADRQKKKKRERERSMKKCKKQRARMREGGPGGRRICVTS